MNKTLRILVTFFLIFSLSAQVYAYEKSAEALKVGQQKLQKKDYVGAREDADEALRLSGNPAERFAALMLMGRADDAAGEPALAREDYRRIADSGDFTASQKCAALMAVAETWLKADAFDNARAAYAGALALPALPPQDIADIRLGLARYQERQLLWSAAREEYKKCLAVVGLPEGRRYSALSGIAGTFNSEKDLSGMGLAVEDLLRVKAPLYMKHAALRNYALLAESGGDNGLALNIYRRIIALTEAEAKTATAAGGTYAQAVFRIIETAADRGDRAELRSLAEKAAANGLLGEAERLTAGLVTAGLDVAGKGAALKGAMDKGMESLFGKVAPEVKIKVCNNAGKIFMRLQDYALARRCTAAVESMYRQEEKKVYECRYVDKAPHSYEGWLGSPLSRASDIGEETRFEDYDRQAAALLLYDVRSERNADGAAADADKGTAFSMLCDSDGWHIFVRCRDAQAEKVAAGLTGGSQLEVFFRPGNGTAYYQWFLGFPQGSLDSADWDSPSRAYRLIRNYCKADVAMLGDGYGASFFIPWEMLYDKLPADGEKWPFGLINWTRAGGMTWGGKVHEVNRWSIIRFSGLTPEHLLEIKRNLIMKGLGRYRKSRADLSVFWKDEAHGDPVFYENELLPAMQRLDDLGKQAEGELTASDIEKLFAQAVPDWMEFPYLAAELRKAYLNRAFFTAG